MSVLRKAEKECGSLRRKSERLSTVAVRAAQRAATRILRETDRQCARIEREAQRVEAARRKQRAAKEEAKQRKSATRSRASESAWLNRLVPGGQAAIRDFDHDLAKALIALDPGDGRVPLAALRRRLGERYTPEELDAGLSALHGIAFDLLGQAAVRHEAKSSRHARDQPARTSKSKAKRSATAGQGDHEAFLSALRGLAAENPAGALLPIRQLREGLPFGKEQFDALALELSREGIVVMHHHHAPMTLSPEERNVLVADDRGTYYIGIALRRPAEEEPSDEILW